VRRPGNRIPPHPLKREGAWTSMMGCPESLPSGLREQVIAVVAYSVHRLHLHVAECFGPNQRVACTSDTLPSTAPVLAGEWSGDR
jgi:hypothetical protein